MPQSNHDLLNNLFHCHSQELLAFAGWRVGDFAAEDLVQETYLRLLQHPEPSSINNPRAYLYKMIANLGFDHHRKESVRNKYAETDEVELDELVSPLPGPEALMEGEMLLRNCLTTLKTLPEVYLHIFLLSRINGLTHNEIAANLQLSRQTVERYCTKAMSQCFTHTLENRG